MNLLIALNSSLFLLQNSFNYPIVRKSDLKNYEYTNKNLSSVINFIPDEQSRDHEEQLLKLSLVSNSLFLTAGCFSFISSSSFCVQGADYASWSLGYKILQDAAPVAYLFNSVLDIILTQKVESEIDSFSLFIKGVQENDRLFIRNNRSSQSLFLSASIRSKLTAHRRALFASVSFFLAALAETTGKMLEDLLIGDKMVEFVDSASIHLYMLSAVYALTSDVFQNLKDENIATTRSNEKEYDEDFLDAVGDILFGIGSLFDEVVCNLHLDDSAVLSILSATLWCCDACLYLKSDFISMTKLKEETAK